MNLQELKSKQKAFFKSNATKDIGFRINQLKKLKKVIKDNESLLYEAIYADFQKSKFETYLTELSQIYHELDLLVKNIRNWSSKKRVSTNLANLPGRSFIIPEPLGNTLVIGAWNYPYMLTLVPVISAMGAGNTIIIKPSELPSATSGAIAKIINENFQQEYLKVIEGGVPVTSELLELKFDKIFFTGSTQVGKIIYKAAAKHLTPVTLELGGKSPTFVFEDCDVKMTAKRIVWAKYLNAGQTCVAPDYIMVEESIKDQFLEAVKKEIETNYKEKEIRANYLQIINKKNYDRLEKLIDRDKLFCGGYTDKEKRLISPTVLTDVTFDDKVMEDEIFGPILPVISFSDLDSALEQVNSLSRPLSCYIYSRSKKNINKVLDEVSFGGGAINDSIVHLANSKLPFGGVGLSGMGAYHGETGFRTFSHYKSILKRTFWFEPPVKYFPYTTKKFKLLKWLIE